MKSKHIQGLLRILLLGAGAGAGVALAFLCVQVHHMTTASAVNLGTLVLLYGGMGALGMLAGHFIAPKAISWYEEMTGALEKYMDGLSAAQLGAMCAGLVTGLLIAALLSQILSFLGDSIFTLAASAMLYVVLGVTGVSIGKRRTEDFSAMMNSTESRGSRRTKQHGGAAECLLDSSVLIDGRVAEVAKTGFLTRELVLPDFVLEELRRLADSADETKRLRGKRGLECAERMQKDESIRLRVEETGDPAPQDADMHLMALARDTGASLMTNDFNLNRAARVAGLTVLNLNDLACALRQAAAAGDVLNVRITKEGRENGQGVGYLDDGTMIVIEGGRARVGETAAVTVTSVLQTSAGRMVFAKLNG